MIKKGVYLSFLTAVISGVSIFSNSVFVSKTDPLVFSLVRNGFVVLIMGVVLLFAGQWKNFRSLTKKEWGMLMAVGAIGGGIPFALFFTGLSRIGAINGNILQKTLFLWVALLAVPFLKEKISRVQLAGYIFLFAGMFVSGGTYKIVPSTGALLVLGATILWAIENIVAKLTLRTVSPLVVGFSRIAFGIPFLAAAVAVSGKASLLMMPGAYAPGPIFASSILLAAYICVWYTALANAPATIVSSVLVFAPVVTAVLSSAFLRMPIAGQQAANLALLTVGTLLVSARQIVRRNQAHSV